MLLIAAGVVVRALALHRYGGTDGMVRRVHAELRCSAASAICPNPRRSVALTSFQPIPAATVPLGENLSGISRGTSSFRRVNLRAPPRGTPRQLASLAEPAARNG